MPDLDTKLEAEIVDSEVERDNKNIPEQLPVPPQR